MIFYIFIYSLLGIGWYWLTMLIAAGGLLEGNNVEYIRNPIIKHLYNHIKLGDNLTDTKLNNIFNILCWILSWPIGLPVTLLTGIFHYIHYGDS